MKYLFCLGDSIALKRNRQKDKPGFIIYIEIVFLGFNPAYGVSFDKHYEYDESLLKSEKIILVEKKLKIF